MDAMSTSAFFACVRVITNTLSSLKPEFRHRNTRVAAPSGIARPESFERFSLAANEELNAQAFLQRVAFDLATRNAHYSRIIRVAGDVVALVPLDSQNVEPVRSDSGVLSYRILRRAKDAVTLPRDQVFSVIHYGSGLAGFDLSTFANGAICEALEAGRLSYENFRDGGIPHGILQIEQPLQEDQYEQVRANFINDRSRKRVMMLEAFAKYTQLENSAEDMQLVETRRFLVQEICRFTGVPPFLVFEASQTTTLGSSLEQMMLAFLEQTISPMASAIEAAFETQLMTREERAGGYRMELVSEPGRFTDSKTLAEGLSVSVQGGIRKPNEARAVLGLPPVEGGDELLINTALARIGSMTSAQLSGT
jgi:HK97 family phage portal protein